MERGGYISCRIYHGTGRTVPILDTGTVTMAITTKEPSHTRLSLNRYHSWMSPYRKMIIMYNEE